MDKHCKAEGGYTGIKNVYQAGSPKDDVQQSFFLAESLKVNINGVIYGLFYWQELDYVIKDWITTNFKNYFSVLVSVVQWRWFDIFGSVGI